MKIRETMPFSEPREVEAEELRGQFPTLDAFLDDEYVTSITVRTSGQAFMPLTYTKMDLRGEMMDAFAGRLAGF